ncbi:Gfo/Idh/MocA family oxidoreductase [Labilibaculum sp. DW002]|uniref:Gfo/Idh/MocA family oxidoreductase n=1 Tax=Paralabilibaculum antarcticum TaxID=2912572 RepID=A0ABT5VRP4_9BACT|nr:Gfo/Idh/MocA family oxidoreductase [Labilibaculum sp. DW002]MDE5416969.1 Gfo/Idh/MocA family oxidoreductase [Labilibaculum sp. DW002]
MTIKWGILGAGRIAKKFAADFKVVTEGDIIAVGSRSKDRSNQFANEFGIANAYSSYEEMLKNENIDVVYVATPHNFHLEHAQLCLHAGKSVLCEKPVTVNSSEFDILQKLAKEKNLFFMEAIWTYYLPAIIQAMQWIKEGKIGKVKQVQVSFGFRGDMDKKERLANPNLAGGALLDIGIYGIAIAELVFDKEVEKIQAIATFSETGIDASNSIQLQYKNGGMAQISSSLVAELKNEAIIYGDKGRIEIPQFWMAKKAILVNDNETLEFKDEAPQMGYNHEADAVNNLIKNEKAESPVIPLVKSKKILSLMDKVREQIGLKYPFEA